MRIIKKILFRGWWARILSAIIQVFSIAAAFILLEDPDFVLFSFTVGVGFLGGQIFGGGWGRKISSAKIFSGLKDEYFYGISSYFSVMMVIFGIALTSIPIFFWLHLSGYRIIIFYNFFFLSLFIGVGLFCAEILKCTKFFKFSFLFERSLPPLLILCAFYMEIYPSNLMFFTYPLIYAAFFYFLFLLLIYERQPLFFNAGRYFGFRQLWGARTFIISAVSDPLVYRALPLSLPLSAYNSESAARFIFVASALNFMNLFFDAKAFTFFTSLKVMPKEIAPDLYRYYINCFFSFYFILVVGVGSLALLASVSTEVWEWLFHIGILQIHCFFLSLSFCPVYFLQGADKANLITMSNLGYFGIVFAFLLLFPNAHIGWLGFTLGVSSALRFYILNFYVTSGNLK